MMPQRYPGHMLKQTFTKFLAEAALTHLKCSFDLLIVAQKEKSYFIAFMSLKWVANVLLFWRLLPTAYYTVSNIGKKRLFEQPISLLFAHGRYNHMFLSDSDRTWEPNWFPVLDFNKNTGFWQKKE